ncbi:MAG: hypothetical protein GQ570_05290 [Helicobacteraceae bacterium]|nr:hypothetical protein [Helicobacteraceae bacterium]
MDFIYDMPHDDYKLKVLNMYLKACHYGAKELFDEYLKEKHKYIRESEKKSA